MEPGLVSVAKLLADGKENVWHEPAASFIRVQMQNTLKKDRD